MSTTLEVQDVHYRYGSREVLSGISLTVRPGEIVALLGANGAGKSTLLRLCLGLERPSGGRVLINGRPVQDYRRRTLSQCIAYVPQSHVSPFPFTVRDVIKMGSYSRSALPGSSSVCDAEWIDRQMARLGIAALAERAYTQISGGERQLVLLCRALVQKAPLLILDEPASALDFGHQIRLLARLRELADEGFCAVMSTHQPQHARYVANRVLLMKHGQIIHNGPAAEVLTQDAIATLYDIAPKDIAALTAMHGNDNGFGEMRNTPG